MEQINKTLLRQLKNTDNEKNLLDREMNRMQNIDRIKAIHARNSFYVPDTQSLLPTLDTMLAASQQNPIGNSPSLTMNSIDQGNISGAIFNNEVSSNRDIVTANEAKGICERYNSKPSQRQRIIIARSQEQNSRPKVFSNSMSNTKGQFNNFLSHQTSNNVHNDSIMSGSAQTAANSTQRPPGTAVTSPHNRPNLTGRGGFGTVDVQPARPLDAMTRIRRQNQEKQESRYNHKKKIAVHMEKQRRGMLEKLNVNMKTTL